MIEPLIDSTNTELTLTEPTHHKRGPKQDQEKAWLMEAYSTMDIPDPFGEPHPVTVYGWVTYLQVAYQTEEQRFRYVYFTSLEHILRYNFAKAIRQYYEELEIPEDEVKLLWQEFQNDYSTVPA